MFPSTHMNSFLGDNNFRRLNWLWSLYRHTLKFLCSQCTWTLQILSKTHITPLHRTIFVSTDSHVWTIRPVTVNRSGLKLGSSLDRFSCLSTTVSPTSTSTSSSEAILLAYAFIRILSSTSLSLTTYLLLTDASSCKIFVLTSLPNIKANEVHPVPECGVER